MSELRRSYILHPAIGGSHPIPCLSTQITKRRAGYSNVLMLSHLLPPLTSRPDFATSELKVN